MKGKQKRGSSMERFSASHDRRSSFFIAPPFIRIPYLPPLTQHYYITEN